MTAVQYCYSRLTVMASSLPAYNGDAVTVLSVNEKTRPCCLKPMERLGLTLHAGLTGVIKLIMKVSSKDVSHV
jgi:hypothetical protein